MPRKQFIEDLQAGDSVKSAFALERKALRQFRNKPGQFLVLTLRDRTGSVTANVWDDAEETAANLREGDIVHVTGAVEEYQGRRQFVLSSATPTDPTQVDLSDFLPTTQADMRKLRARIESAVQGVAHPAVRALLDAFFADPAFVDRFLEAPAAKALHHARLGGLAEHICSALDVADAVCEAHPALDRDLVVVGVLLHDVGKLWELDWGATISYSAPGRLIGHICLGYGEVDRRCRAIPGFPEETRLRILHIILSHHGVPEYGSPVRPMTPEAMAVHAIENCDAQVSQFVEKVAAAVEQGRPFTEFDNVLERYLYVGGGLERRNEPSAPDAEGSGGSPLGGQGNLF